MTLVVVGIGEDGWSGLGPAARDAVGSATEIVAARRILAMLEAAGDAASISASRRELPSPLEPFLAELAARAPRSDERVCLLASGDPMLHGIGASLARRLSSELLEVHPHVSAFSLACARLRWPAAEVTLLSTVFAAPEIVAAGLQPGRRLVVLVPGARGAAAIAAVLRERGFGSSRFIVLERLGGPAERVIESTADEWGMAVADPLHAVAIEVAEVSSAGDGARGLALAPGLPDDAYEHDGQLTKREVRAVTLAALGPSPGLMLWDVGAGSGSIGIEWLRAGGGAAVAVEADPERAGRISRNAARLGVPQITVRAGRAPEALGGLPAPDAVFVGGGLGDDGLLEECIGAVRGRGLLVANAVTLEGESALTAYQQRAGGTLRRIEISHARPVGSFLAWRARMPVTQWEVRP